MKITHYTLSIFTTIIISTFPSISLAQFMTPTALKNGEAYILKNKKLQDAIIREYSVDDYGKCSAMAVKVSVLQDINVLPRDDDTFNKTWVLVVASTKFKRDYSEAHGTPSQVFEASFKQYAYHVKNESPQLRDWIIYCGKKALNTN